MKVKVTFYLAGSDRTPEFFLTADTAQDIVDHLQEIMSEPLIIAGTGQTPWIVNTNHVQIIAWTRVDEE